MINRSHGPENSRAGLAQDGLAGRVHEAPTSSDEGGFGGRLGGVLLLDGLD